VNISTGLFNDFATPDTKGDAIDFLKMRYGMSFLQAKEHFGGKSYTRPMQAKAKAPAKQAGSKADYTLRELVKGGIHTRGTIEPCEIAPDYNNSTLTDCFHSIYLHSPEILTYQKQHCGKLAGYSGAVWCDVLYFDIDYKDGTLCENITAAQQEAKRLIQKLKSNGISTFNIKLSGSKGFHVSIKHSALNQISGYIDTPKYTEVFARKLSAGIACDYSIYGNCTRLIRSTNSINSKSGLYAIPLSEGELFTLSTDAILLLAKKPRPQPKEFKTTRIHSRLFDMDATVYADNVVFDNGTVFTKPEIDLLAKEKNKENIKAIFTIKNRFGGTVRGTK
jgi:hypothetical protein